ncbi:MAG: lysophospholipid acyltransferase family protein [Eubacteriaceae bacterium]
MFYSIIRFIVNIYISLFYKFEVNGIEKIPSNGAIIICSNHIHWADPIILACKGIKRHVHFLGKNELFKNKFFSTFLKGLNVIPIKRGESDVSAIKNSLRILKNSEVLGIFPEGTRVKEGEDRRPELGLALLAIKSKATIIPIGIIGNYKIRTLIKLNIGEPIILNEYFDKKVKKDGLENISQEIMKEIKKLVK